MTRTLRLAAAARADIERILRASAAQFGEPARVRYARLISVGLADLRADPFCIGAKARAEIGDGLRTYHLSCCRKRAAVGGRRIGTPRHLLQYRIEPDGAVAVLPVLHEAMELAEHVPRDQALELARWWIIISPPSPLPATSAEHLHGASEHQEAQRPKDDFPG